MNDAFVFYRYPHAGEYTIMRQTKGVPAALGAYEEVDGMSGFVFAPFRITAGCPLLVLKPDIVEQRAIDGNIDFNTTMFARRDLKGERGAYGNVFKLFHDKLESGRFSKIVLSRRSLEQSCGDISPAKLFLRACALYPRMFVALVSMPQCGAWLMATPEILIESDGPRWHTMAVAGTMHIEAGRDTDANLSLRKTAGDISEWNAKNIQEQKYVSQYILDCLKDFAADIETPGPYSLRAGMVKHLATDFTFTIGQGRTPGGMISALHPTPAVCGMPKADAYQYINDNEGYDRMYYSGFAGPLDRPEGTHLYVTLRCMQANGHDYRLYAGGGLLRGSEEESEWLETETKMETMRRCLAIRRT